MLKLEGPEPEQIAVGIHVGGFLQDIDCGIEVARIARRLRRQQLFVQRLDGHVLFLRLCLSLLLRLHLLRRQPLALGCGCGFLLEVNVLIELIEADSELMRIAWRV